MFSKVKYKPPLFGIKKTIMSTTSLIFNKFFFNVNIALLRKCTSHIMEMSLLVLAGINSGHAKIDLK